MPVYDLDKRINVYREFKKPPESLFIACGHDIPNLDGTAIENPKKHYRRFFEDELENNKEIFTRAPFDKLEIIRTKSTCSSLFSMFGGGGDDLDTVET
mgnify:CR=1 FL=1